MAEFDKRLGAMTLILASGNSVSRTALNKLLYFSDVAHLMRCGELISSATYRKLPYGPVPDGMELSRNALINWNFLEERVVDGSLYYKYEYKTNEKEVDLDIVSEDFSPEKIETLENVRRKLSKLMAVTLSEASHRFEPWKSAGHLDALDLNEAARDLSFRAWFTSRGVDVGTPAGEIDID